MNVSVSHFYIFKGLFTKIISGVCVIFLPVLWSYTSGGCSRELFRLSGPRRCNLGRDHRWGTQHDDHRPGFHHDLEDVSLVIRPLAGCHGMRCERRDQEATGSSRWWPGEEGGPQRGQESRTTGKQGHRGLSVFVSVVVVCCRCANAKTMRSVGGGAWGIQVQGDFVLRRCGWVGWGLKILAVETTLSISSCYVGLVMVAPSPDFESRSQTSSAVCQQEYEARMRFLDQAGGRGEASTCGTHFLESYLANPCCKNQPITYKLQVF